MSCVRGDVADCGLTYTRNSVCVRGAQDFANLAKKRGNDYLRIASTFHGFHVMAATSCPVPVKKASGIETLEAGNCVLGRCALHC